MKVCWFVDPNKYIMLPIQGNLGPKESYIEQLRPNHSYEDGKIEIKRSMKCVVKTIKRVHCSCYITYIYIHQHGNMKESKQQSKLY